MRIETNRVNSAPVSGEVAQPRLDTAASAPETAPAEQPSLRLPGSQSANPHETAAAELEQVVEKMNKAVQGFNQALQFEVTKSNRIIIRVLDKNTGEIIRQIPPEELMDTFKRMEDALGLLIDRRV